MFKARSSARRLGWAVLLGALSMAASACGLLIGLEDHRAFPGSDAGEDANDPPDALADVVSDAPADGPDGCAGTMCNGVCTDVDSSPASCGACNALCPGDFTCVAGVCGNRVEQISAGANHGCALLHDGSIWCWGNDSSGQLGIPAVSDMTCDGPSACHPVPIKVAGLPAKMRQVVAGVNATCALDASGVVWCWGLNDSLQLGRSTAPDSPTLGVDRTPAPVPGLPPVAQLAFGDGFVCARLKDGSQVYCWGSNDLGTLGNGKPAGQPAGGGGPGPVAAIPKDIVDISTGLGGHACALTSTQAVYCWGSNTFGQLGHASSFDALCPTSRCNSTPSVVPLMASGARVVSMASTTCTEASSSFVCWGSNVKGELVATPDALEHSAPAKVPTGFAGILGSFQGSYASSCFFDETGITCWGDDTYGGLGRGAITALPCATGGFCNPKPVNVKLPAGFVPSQIATGAYWAMALSSDNRIVAWGANLDGRLGHVPGAANDIASCGYDGKQHCNPFAQAVPQPGMPAPGQ